MLFKALICRVHVSLNLCPMFAPQPNTPLSSVILTRAILLYRGQLGMSEEQQKQALELRHMTNGVAGQESSAKESPEANGTDGAPAGGCCQGNGGALSCCQSDLPEGKQDKSIPAEQNRRISKTESVKESVAASKGRMRICRMPTWFETWDRSDTYTTLAVVAAAATVFVAFRAYKTMN
uniref:Sucrase/ferredoxin-like family protein n=1 Tax=Aegilops tauschii subsp. strangulata TaxID=200361 RepID=A0A453PGC2_AEGTS